MLKQVLAKLLHRVNQILHGDKHHQILFVGGPNACGWSKHAYNKFKMADSRHFEKSINCHNIALVWPIVMNFGSVTFIASMNLVC